MMMHLLEQAHIHAHIEGQYLQGGVGELPVSGIVRVVVDEDDFDMARDIVDHWQANQPISKKTPGCTIPGKCHCRCRGLESFKRSSIFSLLP